MNRVHSLFASPALSISRVDHPVSCVHRDPRIERAGAYTFNFVEAGHFAVVANGITATLAPGSV